MGTRCRAVEQYLKKEAPHKHLIFILNKCDLVPTWVAVIPLISHFIPLPGAELFPNVQSRSLYFLYQSGPVTTLEYQHCIAKASPRFEGLSARYTVFLKSRVVVATFGRKFHITTLSVERHIPLSLYFRSQ